MDYKENTLLGLEGLKSHLLRSFLSMLGIIFGVGAVIAMLSIGEGAKQQALEQIQLMGMNNIIVDDIPSSALEQSGDQKTYSPGLRREDARAVQELNPLVTATVPVRQMEMEVRFGTERTKATVVGTTPEFVQVMNYVSREGTFFTYDDVVETRRVCALGGGVARALFLFRNPVGELIKVDNQWFTVIGVLDEKTVASSRKYGLPVNDVNQEIYIPITSALRRFTDVGTKMEFTASGGMKTSVESELTRFIARVDDVNRIQEAANILKATLDRRHNSVPDFTITVPEALLRQSRQTQRIFNIVMGAIAGISLLVGGIGIMNIMLASVLERTREIGIRRATGATRKDILGQFLLEAVILSFSGGLIGIVFGFSLTRIIAAYADWRTIVSWEAIALSFFVSVGIGVLFGVYPARRASSMNPIEALRYE